MRGTNGVRIDRAGHDRRPTSGLDPHADGSHGRNRCPLRRWARRILFLAAIAAVFILLRLTVLRPSPVPVTVHLVDTGRVEDTVVNSRAGTVESRSHASMSPGIAGLVAEIPVKKGETVRAGQILLRIDDREYRAAVDLASRSLDAAKASAEEACLTSEQAQRERERAENLAGQGLIATQGLEQARTRAETAVAACAAAREQVRQADAALAQARALFAKTVMVAPFDGVILDIATHVGEWISPSPPGVPLPPVIDLIDPHALYVSAPLDEADVGRVRLALPVRITMDAFRGESFRGHVAYISSFVETQEQQNRTLTIETVFDESADLPVNLVPGLSADVEVILASHDDVLRIPTYALLEGEQVLLVEGNRLVARKVETGLHNWEFTEITSGLRAGDRVVVSLDRPEVKAGARVRVTGEREK